uniref:Uncharacterized protein n=1 Tax=Arundo donax TaxID=35708 RepID=A0A0A9G2T6_ARUDO
MCCSKVAQTLLDGSTPNTHYITKFTKERLLVVS